MKKVKKALIILIVFVLAVNILTSCADTNQDSPNNNQENNNNNANDGGPANESEEAEPEISIFDILPANDFGGMTFTVYVPPNPDSPVDKGTFVEELTGEAFNDAVFNRNRSVEDQI